jgi:hypothetical protein
VQKAENEIRYTGQPFYEMDLIFVGRERPASLQASSCVVSAEVRHKVTQVWQAALSIVLTARLQVSDNT